MHTEKCDVARICRIHEMQRVQNDKRVLQTNCDNLSEKCRMLEDRIVLHTTQLSDAKAELETSTAKFSEAQDASQALLAQFDQDLGLKNVEIKRLEKKSLDLEDALRKHTQSHTAKLDAVEETKAELRTQLETLKATLAEQKTIHQGTVKETTLALKQATDDLHDIKAQHQLLEAAYADVEAALETAVAQAAAHKEEIAELKRVDARRTDALDQMAVQGAELAAARAALADKDGELAQLRHALDAAHRNVANGEGQRDKLERDLEQLRETSAQTRAAHDADKERMAALAADSKTLKDDKAKLSSELHHLQLQVQSMAAAEQRLQAEVTSLRAGDDHSVSAAKLQQLRTTVDTYRAELAEQELLAKEMEQRLEDLISEQADELREKDDMIGKITDEMQNILKKAQSMQEDFDREAQQTKEYKGKVGCLVEDNVALSKQLAVATAAVSGVKNQQQQLVAERDEMKKWNKDLEAQLQDERKDTERKKAELRSAHKIITELKLREETLQLQIDQLKIDLEEAVIQGETLEEEISVVRANAETNIEEKTAEADAVNEVLMQEVEEHITKAEEMTFELQLRTEEIAALKTKHQDELAKVRGLRTVYG